MKIKTISTIIALMLTTSMTAQVNTAEEDETIDDEITVTDQKGRQEVIEFPEAMTYDLDSLLNLYMAKTYLEKWETIIRKERKVMLHLQLNL